MKGQDILLKIRNAKRGNQNSLDLSNCGLSELPPEIKQLSMLESLNVSNNKLINLKRVEQLPYLRELDASNNQIASIHQDLLDMFSIETLYLFGNPIVNSHPQLAKIEKNQTQLKKALESYFGTQNSLGSWGSVPSGQASKGSESIGSDSIHSSNIGSGVSFGNYNKSALPQSTGQHSFSIQHSAGPVGIGTAGGSFSSKPAFLKGGDDLPALKKRISELELENQKLKDTQGNSQLSQSFNQPRGGSQYTGRVGASNIQQEKNWQFGGSPLDRPTTASGQSDKLREMQEELKNEKREKKKLFDEIENLKKDLQKSNYSAFTQGAGTISTSSGRLPQVPGVREIHQDDMEIGEQIAQGGFSVIHKGTLNGTPVAIKKIFDPRLTDELLNEIYNEIVMQSILRHPNVALLMGVIPTIPNIVIVFEYMPQSLFNLLHIKKTQINLTLEQRLKIARDTALVYHYMHSLGIVHRDLKSHNILVDDHLNIKICDFGLARFKADLNKGTMQYSGTPAYMSPELFQKRSYDESVDIFAYGTLLWELISREVPYDGLDPADIRAKVEKEEPLKPPYGTDPRLVQIINDCRQANIQNRPNFEKILFVLSSFVK